MAKRLDSYKQFYSTIPFWRSGSADAKSLDKVRYSRKRFSTLTAEFFILLGCLRQLQGLKIMRDQIQALFDTDDYADKVP